jgi:CubicO group peptidase (beta-lactamase class C family)
MTPPLEKPRTAAELGLMRGFPPAPEQTVTHENQLLGPFNRWSFQNELPLNRVVDVWRGDGPTAALEAAPLDLSAVGYQNRLGQSFSFDEMVELSYTDGIVVLHQGRIIYERYLNGMQPHSLHAWASGSKSMTGTLAALLMHAGLFEPDAPVARYLPELQNSGFGDATVRQVLDMTTALRFPEESTDPISENVQYSVAMGWREPPAGDANALHAYNYLPTLLKGGEHGQRFTYLTPNSDVLAWLMKRLSNQTLAEIMRQWIWSKLGAERDAFWITGPLAVETAGSGLLTTTRDMARFGLLLLQKGRFNGQQILPEAVVADIEAGGDREAFARGPAANPTNLGWSYHHQWWLTHNEHGAYLGLGYGGQMLYIAPAAQLVIAKFSSYPTPTPAGNEFYSAFGAFPALAKWLVERG